MSPCLHKPSHCSHYQLSQSEILVLDLRSCTFFPHGSCNTQKERPGQAWILPRKVFIHCGFVMFQELKTSHKQKDTDLGDTFHTGATWIHHLSSVLSHCRALYAREQIKIKTSINHKTSTTSRLEWHLSRF